VSGMRLTIDFGAGKDIAVEKLDRVLRTAIPGLVGWSYTHETGELTLDFADTEDNALITKIQDWLQKAGGRRVMRFEILGTIREW